MDNDKCGNFRWLCLCDCGKEKIVLYGNLKRGNTKSCGCFKIKHGHTKNQKMSKTYSTWIDMIQRCTNPRDKQYKDYGRRGIKVCKRWLKFENFLKDMGEASEGYQIDRIDNNKGYCKSNCRWVTPKMNNRNKRDNHLETYNGKTQCLVEWAEEFNIDYGTLRWRLDHGWSIGKALTTLVRKYKKRRK